jgi:hypothetical protein
MIYLILLGFFHLNKSLIHVTPFFGSLLLLTHSFIPQYASYNVTMVVNFSPMSYVPFFLPMVFLYIYLTPTSPQNGRVKRMIRTTNDVVRILLFQAKLSPPFWVEALHTSNHILNIRPSRAISNFTPYFLLYSVHPTYDHLRTFGCRCFPNLSHSIDHKLSPCSTRCVLLGYPWEHKGYRCFDLNT